MEEFLSIYNIFYGNMYGTGVIKDKLDHCEEKIAKNYND
jgi:hypothetical protein